MRNRFNRCCCEEIPPPPVEQCRICENDCVGADDGAGNLILRQRHPDEDEEGYVAQGRLTGVIKFSSVNGRFRIIFNQDDETKNFDSLDIQFGEGSFGFRPVRFTLRREGAVVATNSQTLVGASEFSTMSFCFHFDAAGEITIVLFTLTADSQTTHARWTAQLAPGDHGGVGYRLDNVALISGVVHYYRSASEVVGETPCTGCIGLPCDPCCPEGAGVSWLLEMEHALTGVPHDFFAFDVYGGCVLIGDATYILLPAGPCRWSYENFDVGGFAISYNDPNTQPACGDFRDFPGTYAWLRWNLRIVRDGSYCSLVLELLLVHEFNDGSCCDTCLIARWEKLGGIGELCTGSHDLSRTFEEPLLCTGYPQTINVRSL